MNTDHDLRRQVTHVFADEAPAGYPEELLGRVLSTTSRTRPRPTWLADIKEPPMRIPARVTVGSPTFRLTTIVAVSLALILAAAGAVLAAASLLPSPDATLVLTLATPERAGRPSDAFITAFAAAVEQRSGGALTVDIRYPSDGRRAYGAPRTHRPAGHRRCYRPGRRPGMGLGRPGCDQPSRHCPHRSSSMTTAWLSPSPPIR